MTDTGQVTQKPEEHVPDFELRWYTTYLAGKIEIESQLRHNIGGHLQSCRRCENRRIELLDQPVTGQEAYWRLYAEIPHQERLDKLKELGFDN